MSKVKVAVALLVLASGACICTNRPPYLAPASVPSGESISIHGAPAGPDAVVALVRSARFVFLGELHDNPRHHALQAELLQAIVAEGRKPALAFEMLEVDQTMLVRQQRDPSAFGDAVKWRERGWPDYAMYEPLVRIAMASGLPIVAANLGRDGLMKAVERGETPASLGFTRPLEATQKAAIAEAVRAGHCGHGDDAMVKMLAAAQELRDATIAQRLMASTTSDGAVLIAGAEHARRDRGAAFYVSGAPGVDPSQVLSIGLREGDDERSDEGFDVVWRTPAIVRPDPCIAFEKALQRI